MSKDKAAVALGRKRWAGKTEKERKEHALMLADARKAIDPERRREIARKAAAARWAKKKA